MRKENMLPRTRILSLSSSLSAELQNLLEMGGPGLVFREKNDFGRCALQLTPFPEEFTLHG